jgi:acyl carrier protein
MHHPNPEVFTLTQTPAESELALLLVETLNLEDINAADIEPEAPLFGDGLGLDSIDALEMALAIVQQYGVQLSAQDDQDRGAFMSLRTLCNYIEQRKSAV